MFQLCVPRLPLFRRVGRLSHVFLSQAFLAALLRDIRSERAKITEKDNLRLLFVTKWFLEFFLSMRGKETTNGEQNQIWGFGLVAEVTEPVWIVWVLKRMREAVEEKVNLFDLPHARLTRS